MKLGTWLIAAILVVAPNAASAQVMLDDTFPENARITFEELHAKLSPFFNDPRSAQYRDMGYMEGSAAGENGVPELLCGWVNTRNSLGGYGPFEFFGYRLDLDEVELTRHDSRTAEFTRMMAEGLGCPYQG